MKIFLLFLTIFAISFAEEEEKTEKETVEFKYEEDVLVLNEGNFEEALDTFKFLLVDFYAPWCGHCKKLEPEYAKAAGLLKEKNPDIKLAKVDATVEKDLAKKYEVRGYPTLKFFVKGQDPVAYGGTRQAEGIVEWLEKEAIEVDEGVFVLTQGNFKGFIESNEFVLVEFYAPWCGHCKKLAPEYAKAAQQLKEDGSNVKLAKVDATLEKELGQEHGVKGFPTLKFFRSGKSMDYSGPRDTSGIIQWIEKKTGPPAIEVTEVKALEDLKKSEQVLVIGLFKDKESKLAKEFVSAAANIDEYKILISSTDDVIKACEAKDGEIVLFKQFDDPKSQYSGESNAEDIEKWIKVTSAPLVWEFSQASAPKIFGQEAKVHFLYFIDASEEGSLQKLVEPLKPVAKENKGKIVMVAINTAEASNENVLGFFGLKADMAPMYAIFEMDSNAKYLNKANTEAKTDEVSAWVKKYFAKELEKTLKTEEVPEDWDKEPVKVLVGKNFEKVALDKNKDVFVEFYAPWCGHCKALAPTWDKLAEEFADNDNVVIAKLDATANEVDNVNIKSFPTLKMFKKGTNEVVDYTGARDLDTLVHFVKTGEMSLPEEAKKEEKDEL